MKLLTDLAALAAYVVDEGARRLVLEREVVARCVPTARQDEFWRHLPHDLMSVAEHEEALVCVLADPDAVWVTTGRMARIHGRNDPRFHELVAKGRFHGVVVPGGPDPDAHARVLLYRGASTEAVVFGERPPLAIAEQKVQELPRPDLEELLDEELDPETDASWSGVDGDAISGRPAEGHDEDEEGEDQGWLILEVRVAEVTTTVRGARSGVWYQRRLRGRVLEESGYSDLSAVFAAHPSLLQFTAGMTPRISSWECTDVELAAFVFLHGRLECDLLIEGRRGSLVTLRPQEPFLFPADPDRKQPPYETLGGYFEVGENSVNLEVGRIRDVYLVLRNDEAQLIGHFTTEAEGLSAAAAATGHRSVAHLLGEVDDFEEEELGPDQEAQNPESHVHAPVVVAIETDADGVVEGLEIYRLPEGVSHVVAKNGVVVHGSSHPSVEDALHSCRDLLAHAVEHGAEAFSDELEELELASLLSDYIDVHAGEMNIDGEIWRVHHGDFTGQTFLAPEALTLAPYEQIHFLRHPVYGGAAGPGVDDVVFEEVGRLGDLYVYESSAGVGERWLDRFTDVTNALRAMASVAFGFETGTEGSVLPSIPRDRGVAWWEGKLFERSVEGVHVLELGSGAVLDPVACLPTRIIRGRREIGFRMGTGQVFLDPEVWSVLTPGTSTGSEPTDEEGGNFVFLHQLPDDEEWWVRYYQLVEAAWLADVTEFCFDQGLRHPPALAIGHDGKRTLGVEVDSSRLADRLARAFGQPGWFSLRNGRLVMRKGRRGLVGMEVSDRPTSPPRDAEALWADDWLRSTYGSSFAALLAELDNSE